MMQEDRDLDTLFAAARAATPAPSDALMARVLADAMAAQPKAVLPQPVAQRRGPGLVQRIVWALGGAGVLAGMGTAAMAGLYIGFVQPQALAGLDDAVLGAPLETVELVPGYDGFLDGN